MSRGHDSESVERDGLASVPDVVVYRCRDLGDRVEVGVGEGLLVQEVVWRHIGNVSRVGLAATAGEHADDVTIGVTSDPEFPGAEKAPSS